LDRFEQTLGIIDKYFKNNKFEYAVIGGIAVINYENYRTTNDIDIIIKVDLGNLQKLGEDISTFFKPVFDNAIEFFKKNYVLPAICEDNGIRIDFSAALSGFDYSAIKRAKKAKMGKTEYSVCSIEDLIIYKLVASRYQDLSDVQQLIKSNRGIDRQYLLNTAREFVELDRPDVLDRLQEFLSKFSK